MSHRTFQSLLALLALTCSCRVYGQEQSEAPARKVAFIGIRYLHHGFREDDGSRFRPGAPLIDFQIGGRLLFYQKGKPSGQAELGGFTHSLSTPDIPTEVVTRAQQRNIPLTSTSLRLQSHWMFEAGGFVLPDLLIGYRFKSGSWRYDDYSRGAMTTIPYIKGSQDNHLFFAEYAKSWKRWELGVGVAFGSASIDFRDGEERYLGDNDEAAITSRSGSQWAYHFSVRYAFSDSLGALLRTEQAFTTASGASINDQRFFFGVNGRF